MYIRKSHVLDMNESFLRLKKKHASFLFFYCNKITNDGTCCTQKIKLGSAKTT